MAVPPSVFEALSKDACLTATGMFRCAIEAPKFDLDSYIQNYSGRTRFERLAFIGQRSAALSIDALKAAVIEAKRGSDCERYRFAQSKLATLAPQELEAVCDVEWLEQKERDNKAKSMRLEEELRGYKNNLIKESIRMGNEDLGRHYQEIGDLTGALEAFNRMRQDVLIQRHMIEINKHLIAVAVEQRNWVTVGSNVQKMSGFNISLDEEKTLQPLIKVAAGLACLAEGKFLDASTHFIGTDCGMGSTFNYILSPNDVAVYGGLCALASMNRDELQRRVLDNSNFRVYLELEPHIRRAISFFVTGRYSACLSILEGYRNDYLLDIHLYKHVAVLYDLIRSKSIIQYFIPFSCVTIDNLNESFAPKGGSIKDELITMIKSGALEARIDTQNRLLTAVSSHPRVALQSQTLASAKSYEREMCHRIQRINIINADLEVRAKKFHGQSQAPSPSSPDMIYEAQRTGFGNLIDGE